ncbi:hypothetical protein Patl1_22253 [Pistacia atlantica]|uniref:Uncharacterized protein n=1 Tax=Pistacia atlantica TaxID=434234 RepID=A0ACC1BKM0_9ROSI|nr:hypothetical protein Patl1_22253 [Pistacia atlantica]
MLNMKVSYLKSAKYFYFFCMHNNSIIYSAANNFSSVKKLFQVILYQKGWKVLPLFRNIHHSPEIFPDPEKFDPSRFEVSPKPNTFMPFGNGTHSCPGNELAKLEILVLLHHLTTKYRWNMVGSLSGIQYGPFALPQDGLPIKLTQKS